MGNLPANNATADRPNSVAGEPARATAFPAAAGRHNPLPCVLRRRSRRPIAQDNQGAPHKVHIADLGDLAHLTDGGRLLKILDIHTSPPAMRNARLIPLPGHRQRPQGKNFMVQVRHKTAGQANRYLILLLSLSGNIAAAKAPRKNHRKEGPVRTGLPHLCPRRRLARRRRSLERSALAWPRRATRGSKRRRSIRCR